jgi:hypothetical protein
MDATGGETGVTGEGSTSGGAATMVGDEGTEKVKVNDNEGGDIAMVDGDEGVTMGETICETLSQIGRTMGRGVIGSVKGIGDKGTMGDTSGDAIGARSEAMEESW